MFPDLLHEHETGVFAQTSEALSAMDQIYPMSKKLVTALLVVHPIPAKRFNVTTLARAVSGSLHLRICTRGAVGNRRACHEQGH